MSPTLSCIFVVFTHLVVIAQSGDGFGTFLKQAELLQHHRSIKGRGRLRYTESPKQYRRFVRVIYLK